MPVKYLTRRETPWIAEGVHYVYKDKEVHQDLLTYGLVDRRMFNRIERDMTHTIEEHEGSRRQALTNGWGELAYRVYQMEWLAWLILNTEESAFDFELREDGRLIGVEEHKLGQYYGLLAPLILDILYGDVALDRFRLTPHADLFRDAVKCMVARIPSLQECLSKPPTFYDKDTTRYCGEHANGLIVLVRDEAKARKLSKKVAACKAAGKRAHGRMQEVMREYFERQKELHLMLIECAYPPELAAQVPLAEAKRDHARFVNRLRGNVKFAAVAVGGIWVLAWGERKGHHFRWIFMLDASLVLDSTEWAELVGSVWKGTVRDGAGYVRVPGISDHPSLVAGAIHADDAEKMKLLDDEIEYLAWKDTLIQHKEAVGARSWDAWVPANTRGERRRRKAAQSAEAAGTEEISNTPQLVSIGAGEHADGARLRASDGRMRNKPV